MPEFLERKLKAAAAKKGFSGKKAARYVYGAMNNLGAMHGNQETAKGAKMQAKHEQMLADMAKYKGKSSTFRNARPTRKTVNRYQ